MQFLNLFVFLYMGSSAPYFSGKIKRAPYTFPDMCIFNYTLPSVSSYSFFNLW